MLSAMWAIVAMEYGKWKRTIPTEAPLGAGPVDMSRRVRLTVNISCGLLALLSSVILVVIHSSLYLTIANFIADFEKMVQKIVTSNNCLQFPEFLATIRENFREKTAISVDS